MLKRVMRIDNCMLFSFRLCVIDTVFLTAGGR